MYTTNEACERLGIRHRQTLFLWLEKNPQYRPQTVTSTRGDLGWTDQDIETVRQARLSVKNGRPKTRV